jgi:hypothetical protein
VWIAIFGAFILVTALFGHSQERSDHRRPAAAEVTDAAEPGVLPHAEGAPVIYRRD